ncbi:MAG: hypothetical protein KKG76_05335 [Euryarchaeota archaeon]|nr:hypothetical protein [Euryarchaeota archaeon]MBU4140181.1 hypothetical protein [Euryarchaeota archaeon]
MENEINIFLSTCSVIIGFIGFFFVLKIWLVWKRLDKNVLKARVFLDPNFLIRNWLFIFIAGAFIVIRRILHLFDLLELPKPSVEMTIIFDLMGMAVVVLLVILAYYWYKLVHSALEHNVRKDVPYLHK